DLVEQTPALTIRLLPDRPALAVEGAPSFGTVPVGVVRNNETVPRDVSRIVPQPPDAALRPAAPGMVARGGPSPPARLGFLLVQRVAALEPQRDLVRRAHCPRGRAVGGLVADHRDQRPPGRQRPTVLERLVLAPAALQLLVVVEVGVLAQDRPTQRLEQRPVGLA